MEMRSYTGVLFDLDGTLINSEGLGTEAYNYGIRKILNRDLDEHEKQYLLGKPFKALKELFPFLSLLEIERIIEEHWDTIKNTIIILKNIVVFVKCFRVLKEMDLNWVLLRRN
ncbi:HAD hydrolase-like protein [Paenibacillus sp. RC67]|uniref:HAD family hydrolase n=1 Tax=Paenibacillus sp. RC67 TaxID=3039392 RepID=UPI0024AE2F8F|nr:HAD hydrolase-like protein [Paenibacillus sp. RC67]